MNYEEKLIELSKHVEQIKQEAARMKDERARIKFITGVAFSFKWARRRWR